MKKLLNKEELFKHWINFIMISIPISFIGYASSKETFENGEFPFIGLIVIGVLLLFLHHKLVSPKLHIYNSRLTEAQFKQANQAAALLNEWIILSNRKDYFVALKKTDWQWEGIKITTILDNDKLYLNSMVNPSLSSNPFTFGLNKKNKLELIRQYRLILKGENVVGNAKKELDKREELFWNESEWNLKNSLTRIVGYVLSIFFIVLGVWLITEGELKALAIAIPLIGFCLTYIFQDVKVILEKRNRKKN